MLCECLEKALNQEIERCRIDAQRQSDETENEEEREFIEHSRFKMVSYYLLGFRLSIK